ncbi:MAG: hypothetical protein L0Z62_09465 [Gemmataceae bacterium]|nr:hypothetical protein [Gemmataceae bacterium]
MRGKRAAVAAFLLFSLTLVLPVRSARADQELLELVRAGHRAALQSIRTFACRVALTETPAGDFAPPSGEYLRSADTIRVRWRSYGILKDSLRQDFRIKTVVGGRAGDGRGNKSGIIARDAGQPLGECDVWPLGLLTFPDPEKTATVTFDEFLDRPHKLGEVTRRTESGRERISVAVAHELLHTEVWFDPAANYLVWKRVTTTPPRKAGQKAGRIEAEVIRFKEVARAIFFPECVEWRYYLEGRRILTQRVTLSGLRVNEALPPETFRLPFPRGAQVLNHIQGQEYRADEDGNPIGPTRPLAEVPPPPAGSVQREETSEEPKPLTRWILPVSLGTLGLAVFLRLARKWRREEANPPAQRTTQRP